jgi:hypothetical protein
VQVWDELAESRTAENGQGEWGDTREREHGRGSA